MAEAYAAVIKLEVEKALQDARKFLSHLDPAEEKFRQLAGVIDRVADAWTEVSKNPDPLGLTKAAQLAREVRAFADDAVNGDARREAEEEKRRVAEQREAERAAAAERKRLKAEEREEARRLAAEEREAAKAAAEERKRAAAEERAEKQRVAAENRAAVQAQRDAERDAAAERKRAEADERERKRKAEAEEREALRERQRAEKEAAAERNRQAREHARALEQAYKNSYVGRLQTEMKRLADESRVYLSHLDSSSDEFRRLHVQIDRAAGEMERFGPAMTAADATGAIQGMRRLRDEAQGAAAVAQIAQGKMRGASLASQNLVRVIQDLPYGIMGIANNVEMVAQDFALMRERGLSAGEAVKNMVAGLAGPMMIPLLISLVTALALSWDKVSAKVASAADWIKTELGLMTDAQRELNRAVEEAEGKASGLFEDLDLQTAVGAYKDLETQIETTQAKIASHTEEWRRLHQLYRRTGDETLQARKAQLREEVEDMEEFVDTAKDLVGEAADQVAETASQNKKEALFRSLGLVTKEEREEAIERHREMQRLITRISREGFDQRLRLFTQEAMWRVNDLKDAGDEELAELERRAAAAERDRMIREENERVAREAEAAQRKREAEAKRRAEELKQIAERNARAEAEIQRIRTSAVLDGVGERVRLMQLEMDERIRVLEKGVSKERELAAVLRRERERVAREMIASALGETMNEIERTSIEVLERGAERRVALIEWEAAERRERLLDEAADAERAAEELSGEEAEQMRSLAAQKRGLAELLEQKAGQAVREVRLQEAEKTQRETVTRLSRHLDEQARAVAVGRQVALEVLRRDVVEGRATEEEYAAAAHADRLAAIDEEIEDLRRLALLDVKNKKDYLAQITVLEAQRTLIEEQEANRRILNKQREAAEAKRILQDSIRDAVAYSSSAAQTLYDVWAEKRGRELDDMGTSEAEKAAIIEREGARRFRTMKALMVAEALVDTVSTGVAATQSIWTSKLPLEAKIGLTATLVPALLASLYAQVAQIRAIEPGSGGGGGGGGFSYSAGAYERLNPATRDERRANVRFERARDAVGQGDPETRRLRKAVEAQTETLHMAFKEGRDVAVYQDTAERVTRAGQKRRAKLIS